MSPIKIHVFKQIDSDIIMFSKVVFFLVVLGFSQKTFALNENYYWRQYNDYNFIPRDAVVGGQNSSNKNIYIGRGYLRDYGVDVLQITPGEKELTFPYYGVPKTNTSSFVEVSNRLVFRLLSKLHIIFYSSFLYIDCNFRLDNLIL